MYILFVFGARKMKSITTIIVQNVKTISFKKLRSKIDVPKLRILAQKSNVQSSKCTDQFTKCLRQVQWLTRDEIMAMWALKGSFWNKFVPKLWFVGPIYYFLTSKLGCRVPPTFLYKI